MPTFYCNYFFCLELGGPLHSGAPWTLPTLPTPLLRHWIYQNTPSLNIHSVQEDKIRTEVQHVWYLL